MNISYYLMSILFSFAFTYLLVPLNIRMSQKYGLLDHPHDRGIHKEAIPLAGGFSFALPIFILQLVLSFYAVDYTHQLRLLTLYGMIILLVGYLDDKKKFTAKYKLLFQILVAVLLYAAGFRIEILTNPFGDSLNLGILSFPITVAWFLLLINAFNLVDGLDGLATGIAILVSLVLFVVGIINGHIVLSLLSLALVGSCGAFLRFNFFPARIFMGDTGSMFLGLEVAAISVIGSAQYKGITAMTMILPISVLIIPLTDTLLAVLRRVHHRRHIFQGDKQHIHHKLLNLGLNQKAIALISYFITFLFGLVALGFSLTSKEILFILLVCMILLLFSAIILLFKKEFWK